MANLKKIIPAVSAFGVLSAFFGITFVAFGQSENSSDIIPCSGVDCDICSVFQLISNIVKFAAFKIAAPLGGLIMAYGGIMMITSGANEKNKETGKNAINAAIFGLLITFAAWLIVNTVLGALANESFSKSWYQFPGCK